MVAAVVLVVIVGIVATSVPWPDSKLKMAENAVKDGDLTRAEAILAAMTAEQPKQLDLRVLYAQVLRRLGKLKAAKSELDEALANGLAVDRHAREMVYVRASRRFDLAAKDLEEILKKDARDTEALEILGDGYLRQGRWRDAERVYTNWLEVDSKIAKALQGRATVRFETRRYGDAAADFRAALRLAKNTYPIRMQLASCLFQLQEVTKAEKQWRLCSEQRPRETEAIYGLARCALKQNNDKKAEEYLRQVLLLNPTHRKCLHELGTFYLRGKRYEEGAKLWKEFLQYYETEPSAHLCYAHTLERLGKTELSSKHVERYKELDLESAALVH